MNSVGDGVKVLSGVKNLQNICNDDLDDYAEFIGLADATVVGAPVFSVKDNQHYYAGGMEAGFTICANSKSGLLSLDLASFFKIQFLKDGEAVGGLCDIVNAKNVTGIGLSLITIPGSDLVTKSFIAKAPGDFDEIKLVRLGVVADALATFNVKYAFVGSAREYTITNNKENGISKYATDFGRGEIKLEAHGISPTAQDGSILLDRVIDDNLDNGFIVSAVLKVGSSLPVTVVARTTDGKEAFPAGTEVGFKYNSSTVLDLGVGNGASITLYDKDNKEIDTYIISGTVLGLGVIKVSKEGEMILKAPKDFSSAKLQFPGVLDLKLGGDKVNYAFVRMAPSLASHHCKINAPLTRNVAAYEKEFTLQSNPNIPVVWKLEEQPEGSNITLDETTGKVSNISVPGDYKFTVEVTSKDNCKFLAEGKEACKETTIVHYANAEKKAVEGMTLLVNNEGEPVKYQLSDKFGGGLLSIADGVKNASAVLTSALSDFTYRIPSISLAKNSCIVGIKSVDGSNLAKSLNEKKMRAGFVVSTKTSGLSADVLNLYNIKLFKNGEEVMHSATTNWDAISAGLIGSEQSHKMRLSIDVPQGADFDEIVLYNTGVLEANLSQLNIYYAYVCDADKDNATSNVMQDAQVVSTENTNASIDLENTTMFNVANVGNGNNNMSNLIDGDDETAFTLPLGVDLGGSTVAVNIGKTVNPGQQLVMLTNNLSLGLGVSLGKVLKMTTWLNGEEQEELTNWQVLKADVIGTGIAPKAAAGTGGKGYVALTPTKPFDNVRICQVNVLSLLQDPQIYSLAVRDLVNDDGSIDKGKDLLLDEDKTLDEKDTYTGAKMIFHRTFNKDKWNSLILPVDMTAAQVENAFGKGTEVSRFNRLKDNWIYFTPVTEDNGVLIHKNIPYIIKPTKEPFGNAEYTVGSSIKTIEGPVYIATGISYTDETATLKHQDDVYSNGMIHYGSYVRQNKTNDANDFVPMGAYMLNNGDMVHTAKNHYVKGYRCWLEETTPSGKTLQMAFTTGDNNTTGIKTVEEQNRNDKMGIYSISGVRMNSNNADNLPKGMYIVNNKKVFVK